MEIEDGAISYNIRWRGGSFKGVKLSDGTFLERMDVYLSGRRKGGVSTEYQAFFRAPPFSPKLQYSTENTPLQNSQLPVSELFKNKKTLACDTAIFDVSIGNICVVVQIRANNFIQQSAKKGGTGGPLRLVHFGDIMLQKTVVKSVNGVTVITVGQGIE